MSVFQRRLASSTSALLCSFERRIGKLERDIAERRTGNLDEVRRRRRERCLASRRREDFFDTHGAAEDIREDGAALGDGSEDFEDAILGAVTAVTIEDCGTKSKSSRVCAPAPMRSSMPGTSPGSRSSARCSKIRCTPGTSG